MPHPHTLRYGIKYACVSIDRTVYHPVLYVCYTLTRNVKHDLYTVMRLY